MISRSPGISKNRRFLKLPGLPKKNGTGECKPLKAVQSLVKLVVIGCLVTVFSCQTLPIDSYPNAVGAVTRAYTDPSRERWNSDGPRPLSTMIWYPADTGRRTPKQRIAIFKTGRYRFLSDWNQEDVRYPLIVVSHGTGGSAASIAWLCVKLASAGNVVVAVNHHGNTGAERNYLPEGFICWWERPADISALIDNLLLDPVIGDRIDPERVGVAGFSLGGYTALATVGARLDVERWRGYCSDNESDPICHFPPEAPFATNEVTEYTQTESVRSCLSRANDSYLDERIGAAFVIAPVGGPLITDESLQSIRVPVKLIVGSEDDQGVPTTNAVPLADSIPNSEITVLPGVTHYTFLSRGVWWGKIFARRLFRDPEGIERAVVHENVGQEAVEFFRSRL